MLFKPVRKLKRRFANWLIERGSKSAIFATFYYVLYWKIYAREKMATLEGKRKFSIARESPDEDFSLLRRNTHRLEKGLLMRPRRIPFAMDYIGETVRLFIKVSGRFEGKTKAELPLVPEELKWTHDVLKEYFDACRSCREVERFRDQFGRSQIEFDQVKKFVPYIREPFAESGLNFDSLLRLAKYRRSVRWFLTKSVPRELVDKAIQVAGFSPSACNRQPYQFVVVDDPKLVKQIVTLPAGTGGYANNIPSVAIVIGKQSNYLNERDRHLIYIDSSLAAMSFVYALEVQGVSSCCINWPDVEERELKMQEILGLSNDERPIMLVAYGYADPSGKVAYSAKKPLLKLRRYNKE